MTDSFIRVLIIEDDRNYEALLKRLLSKSGTSRFTWQCAATLATGIAQLQEAPFDVILLDLGLPDSSGLDTLRAVRNQARDIPILVLTGLFDESMAMAAFRAGATEYLLKTNTDEQTLKLAIRYAIERERAEERSRSLARKLVDVQERERRKIARELHDEIGQSLTALDLMLKVAAVDRRTEAKIGEAREILGDLTAKVRNMSLNLRPAMLDDMGLLHTLIWLFDRYTQQTKITVGFTHVALRQTRNAAELETAAYRIVQEALTNVARHAKTEHAEVRFRREEDRLHFEIVDRGAGFDPDTGAISDQAVGLASMRERATLLGGRLSIDSSPGKGTRIKVMIPFNVSDSRSPGPGY
jgi:signal transduction histidine kinase